MRPQIPIYKQAIYNEYVYITLHYSGTADSITRENNINRTEAHVAKVLDKCSLRAHNEPRGYGGHTHSHDSQSYCLSVRVCYNK